MKAIINGMIIKENEVLLGKVLLFEKKIIGIIEQKEFEKQEFNCEEIIDAEKGYVSPGFIDMHIHGSGGFDVMDGTREALETISTVIAENGVTGFLPTTMTMSKEKVYAALDNVRELMNSEPKGAKILGVHMEGPFISTKYKGAQNGAFIIKPDFSYIENYKDVIKLITLAPEEDEDHKFIKEVKEKTNIILSIGHSNANYEEALQSISDGISHATHTFNAMTPFNHREPGIVGAVFNSDIYCELIADKIHVHPAVFKLLKDIKGIRRVVLITDSMRAGCLKDGISELGGQKVIVKENSARLEDGTLAGSILKLNQGVKNFMEFSKIDIVDAISTVSINPARELGIDNDKGSIEIGKASDIVILDEEFKVKQTIVEGITLFKQ